MNDMLLQDMLDHLRTRFYGKYRGVVTDVDATTMRIKASVPSVLGVGTTSGGGELDCLFDDLCFKAE